MSSCAVGKGFCVVFSWYSVKLPPMSRLRIPTWAASRPSTGLAIGVRGILAATLVGAFAAAAPAPAEAAWGVPCALPPVRSAPPDQSWLQDPPEKSGARSRGKVAVFVFKGDDVYEPVRAAVVRMLRKQGLNVTATLRPVDSPKQYREMSYALKLAVFVEGEVSGEGASQAVTLRLRSGVTGQYFTTVRFAGPTPKIVGDIGRTLWTRVGSATIRACASASKPRQREVAPMYIEAGTPLASTPVGS